MAQRLDLDDDGIGSLFGVEVDPAAKRPKEDKRIRVKEKETKVSDKKRLRWFLKPGQIHSDKGSFGDYYTRAEEFVGNHPIPAVAGAVVVGGTLWAGLSRLFGKSAAADPKPAPAPPSPGSATAHAGAVLVVRTGKDPKVPGVLRAAAGKGAAQLALVPNGTAVTVVDSAVAGTPGKRWYQVEVPGKGQGWMHGDILAATQGGA